MTTLASALNACVDAALGYAIVAALALATKLVPGKSGRKVRRVLAWTIGQAAFVLFIGVVGAALRGRLG